MRHLFDRINHAPRWIIITGFVTVVLLFDRTIRHEAWQWVTIFF